MLDTRRYLLRLTVFTVLIFVVLCALRPDAFLSADNLTSMAFQFPEFALLALAMHPTFLTGGIDLSVVSLANGGAIVAATLMRGGGNDRVLPAVAAAVAIGVVGGVVNGVLVGVGRLPAILATLGTLQLYAGLAIVVTHGSSILGMPPAFTSLGNAQVAGVPVPALVFAAAAAAIWVLTVHTPLGKQMRLYGTNPRAAEFAGLPVVRTLVLTYAVSGLVAACAGLVILARVNSANADYGTSYLLLSVLINVLAGVNPNGGSGTVLGVILAVGCLQFLSSGLNLLQANNFTRDLMYGALLVVVMVANRLQRRLPGAKKAAEPAA